MARFALFLSALAAALSSSLVASPLSAGAQPRAVLVLPWAAGESDATALAARARATAATLASPDLAPMPVDAARTRFEERGSTAAEPVADADVDRWLSLSRLAVRSLAETDYDAAREALDEASTISERGAAELNRDESRARQVLDTCLYRVRVLVETHDEAAADRARECRRFVPLTQPSPYRHPPEVTALLEAVDRELAAAPATLRLDSMPRGCSVRINGVEAGVTPLVRADVVRGDVRVEIACDRGSRGRIHRALVGDGTTTVRVDTRFDRVIRTDGVLRLAYATTSDADEHRLDDAITTAGIVEADEVWLLSQESASIVRIDRVLVGSRAILASVRASAMSGLASAVASLAGAHNEDRTGPEVAPLARWRGGADAPEDATPVAPASWGRADWELGVGVASGIVGVVALAVGLGLADDGYRLGMISAAVPVTSPLYLRSRDAYRDQRTASWALGAAGGVLGAIAVSLAMEEERGTPWWSWVIGGVGVAGAATGVALALTSPECGNQVPDATCVESARRMDLGVSTLGISLPLLAVPIVFVARELTRGRVTPSVELTGATAMIRVEGAW